jgi:hypothetical protein
VPIVTVTFTTVEPKLLPKCIILTFFNFHII